MKVRTKLDFIERQKINEEKLLREIEEAEKNRKNTNFQQIYKLCWQKMRAINKISNGACNLYMFLAERLDNVCGAVVVSRKYLAKELECSVRSISKYTQILEETNALVVIKLVGGFNAYCFDTEHLWTSWNNAKPYALFHANVLAEKDINSTAHKRILNKLKFDAKLEEAKLKKEENSQ